MMHEDEVLNISPIDPPRLCVEPKGIKIDFKQVVADAEMQNVATAYNSPDVRIHDADFDFKVVQPGVIINCISVSFLPTEKKARAREIIRRLAYSFHDFSAREVAANYHRELKKGNGGYERV